MKIIQIILLTFMIGVISGQDYVGTHKCKMCHKKDKTGNQFKIWSKSRHANAFETLKTDEAIKIAKEKGLGNPWEEESCVKCHLTGLGKGGFEIKDAKFWTQTKDNGKPTKAVKRMENLKGIGCEVCHGPGSKYKSKKKMVAINKGTMDGSKLGLIEPTEKLCIQCHNEESPSYKSFNFEAFYLKIAHPIATH